MFDVDSDPLAACSTLVETLGNALNVVFLESVLQRDVSGILAFQSRVGAWRVGAHGRANALRAQSAGRPLRRKAVRAHWQQTSDELETILSDFADHPMTGFFTEAVNGMRDRLSPPTD